MDNAMEFIDNLVGSIMNGINNCTMAKIERFNGVTMRADITPLVRVNNGAGKVEEVSMLIEVPVSCIKAGPFIIRPPYKPGDIVLVVFADSDIENVLLSGSTSNPNSTRKHSLDDAIIVGGIMPFNKTLPSEHLNDLIIAKEDFSTKVVIKDSGDIIIQGGKVYLGSGDASEGVPLGETLKTWLDSHTHEGASPPTSPSPEPSKVVKTI